jgi:hypothetical protein
MLQITRTELLRPSHQSLEQMRQEFHLRQSLYFPGFIDPTLMNDIAAGLETAHFHDTQHLDTKNRRFAKDQTIDGRHVVTHIFHFVLNNPVLFEFVQVITECPKVGSFSGRIYRTASGTDHYLSWHDDRDNGERLIGVSVNLGKTAYSGGIFQLRDRRSKTVLNEISNTATGGALIFRISPDLEHRITPVEGENPKIAGAGWFLSDRSGLRTIKDIATGNNKR